MKKEYSAPIIEYESVREEDVITTSPQTTQDNILNNDTNAWDN